jgi:hypothetical protein
MTLSEATERYLAGLKKPKRAKPVQKEAPLQKEIIKELRKAFPETWISHTKNNSKSAWDGRKNKALGVLKGMPDLSIVPCANGMTGYIEVKFGKIVPSSLDAEQKEFRQMCEAHGIPYACVNSVEDAVDAVMRFKGLRV